MLIDLHRSAVRIRFPSKILNFLHILFLITAQLNPPQVFPSQIELPELSASSSSSSNEKNQNLIDLEILIEKQESHLQKLENLLQILDQTVKKFQLPSAIGPSNEIVGKNSIESVELQKDFTEESIEPIEKPPQELLSEQPIKIKKEEKTRREPGHGSGKGVTVAKYRPAWSERFQFLSAIKVETEVTCLNILPHEDDEGVSKYVAVGDEQGRVYIFLSHGDILVDFLTLSPSPITSMLSYLSAEKNETLLVTGHADGSILVHRVWEMTQGGHLTGEDWHVLAMEQVRVLVSPPENHHQASNLVVGSVTSLEVHQVGKMRYILGTDQNGKIHVFRENGTLYGVAESPSRPLAFLRQRLLFLTETGAASLDLRSMTVRKGECEGLNGSRAVTYAFDASERSKGYGFTSEGDLIHVVLLGDILNFECRVRTKRKSEIDGPLVVQVIKGYLLVGTPEKVFVYNTTSQHYIRVGGPRPLFYASLDEIISAFVHAPVSIQGARKPLIACNRERLVVLGLGDGYVGMYRSNLPVYKAEFNTMLWSSPVLVFLLFLIGAWQFFGKKREAFAIWGSDDPFSATAGAGGSSSSTVSGERSFEDPKRPEVRELRDGLRGPTRRYASPSRYPAGQSGYGGAGTISYRATTVDPNFRTTTEANFRTQGVEPSGYTKRREPMFSSSQVVEDNIH
eukprot:Gb_09292 [translate_table: standard]